MNPFVAFRSSSAAAKTHREFVHVQIQHMNIYDLFKRLLKCVRWTSKVGQENLDERYKSDKTPINRTCYVCLQLLDNGT